MASEGENDVMQAEHLAAENGTNLDSPTNEKLNGEDVEILDSSGEGGMAAKEEGIRGNEDEGMTSQDDETGQIEVGRLEANDGENQQLEGLSSAADQQTEAVQPVSDPEVDSEQATEEDSPSHTPGGTPITKHVQFEEVSDPGDAQLQQSEEPADDPQPFSDVKEPGSEDGYDDSTDAAVSGADADVTEHGADKEESPSDGAIQPVAPSVAVPAIHGNGTRAGLDDHPDDSKPMPSQSSPKVADSSRQVPMSDDMRCKWGCCCGIGWFMVGLVATVIGIMLIVYLRQFWKSNSNPNERLLLYFGIGTCILGVLTLLVALSFWSCACIVWKPSGYNKDVEKQSVDQDTDSTTKVKHLNNLADDYVTSDNKGNKIYFVNRNENDQQNSSSNTTTDETFLV